MFKSPSRLPQDARKCIADALNANLADGLDLTRGFHDPPAASVAPSAAKPKKVAAKPPAKPAKAARPAPAKRPSKTPAARGAKKPAKPAKVRKGAKKSRKR